MEPTLKKTLIVEDSEQRIELFIKLLGATSLITIAKSADRAIEALREDDFDVIFLDHDLDEEGYGEHYDGIPRALKNSGTEVADFMVYNYTYPSKVVIHSLNPYGAARMEKMLSACPHFKVIRYPFPTLLAKLVCS